MKFEQWINGRLYTPDFAYPKSPPPGPEIEIREVFDQNRGELVTKFIVWTGTGSMTPDELQRMKQTLGERDGIPPVQLDVFDEALQNWAEDLISDQFGSRASHIVQALGIIRSEEEGFLPTNTLVSKVVRSTELLTPLTDDGGVQVSLLDLFNGDARACQYTVLLGIFVRQLEHFTSRGLNTEFMREVFGRAAQKLNFQMDDYEHSLQVVNNSALLHLFLYPNYETTSIHQSIQGLLQDSASRKAFDEQLTLGGQMLLEASTQQHLFNVRLLPAGSFTHQQQELQPQQAAAEANELAVFLSENPVAGLAFVLYIMSDNSHQYLLKYLNARFGIEEIRRDLPIIEVDNGTEEEDGS